MHPSAERPLGRVSLVGAGPGDPGLLTRKGCDLLRQADVVVYDHLVNPRLLDLAPSRAEKRFAGKHRGKFALPQEEINDLLVDLARRGLRVVRLKGGDPLIFGRGAEEAEHLLASGIPFEIVPGVTAGAGVTAYAGIPVTHRAAASAVAFVTGHDDPAAGVTDRSRLDWSALAKFPGTIVVYMGVTRLPAICRALVDEGKSPETPAAIIRAGTTAEQRTIVGSLAELPELAASAGITPPAILVVGEVLRRRDRMTWFERRPLFGQRIVITRPIDEADRSASVFESLGAEVLVAPMVLILPPADFAPVDGAIERLGEFEWLVFTSANGVRSFLDRIETIGKDLRVLGGVKIAAIGPTTAEALRAHRLHADLIPASFRSEALAEALIPVAAGKRVLLARADRGRVLLQEQLERVAIVERIAVYRNEDAPSIPDFVLDRLASGTVDWVTFTSPAILERFHSLIPDSIRSTLGKSLRTACISPVTGDAGRRLGFSPNVEADVHTWEGLAEALIKNIQL